MLSSDPIRANGAETRAFTEAALLLSLVVLIGTIGFVSIEGWDLGRALYFTVITITTVGYGDEGISQGGRVFATLLLLGGLGVASHSFAQLVQAMSNSERVARKRMQARIDKLRDHVIVCGFGRMGRAVCERLRSEGAAFVVIEESAHGVAAAIRAGALAVEGAASADEVLSAAGVERAKHVVSAVDTRESNILITITARGLAPHVRIVARAEDIADEEKLRRAGADVVVSPLRTGGLQAADSIVNPEVSRFLDDVSSVENDVAMTSVIVGAESELAGRALGDYGREVAPHVSFVSLRRGDASPMIPPRGDVILERGDHVIVAGAPAEIVRMKNDALVPSR